MFYLEPAETQKPFVFASYANADRLQVFCDVKRLKDAGVNIWIDEEMSRYIGVDWDKVVRSVMANPNCKALFLFVSKFSLSSSAVQKELEISKSNYIKGMHRGHALPIIQIQVQKYERIVDFCYKVAEDCGRTRCAADIPGIGMVLPGEIVINILTRYFENSNALFRRIFDMDSFSFYKFIEALRRLNVVNLLPVIETDQYDESNLKQGKELYKKMNHIIDANDQYLELWRASLAKFEQAALQNYNKAYLYIGRLYCLKSNLKYSDYQTAQSCLIRAIDCGFKEAKLDMASLLCNLKEYALAKQYISELEGETFYHTDPFFSKYKEIVNIISKNYYA